MSGNMEVGPHDWDEHTRTCKRCGCTTTDWQNSRALTCGVATPEVVIEGTCPKCGAAFSYWGKPSGPVPACYSCGPRTTMAADDAAAIRARMKEIEGETAGKE